MKLILLFIKSLINKSLAFLMPILLVGLVVSDFSFSAESMFIRNNADSRCFTFPSEQTIKVYDSRAKFPWFNSIESRGGQYQIFLVSQSFPSFLNELFSLDIRLAELSVKDQWSYHKFRFSKHLLKAHILSSIKSSKRKYQWDFQIITAEQLATLLRNSTDLTHAIIFLHGDESGRLYCYDGRKVSLDTFTDLAPNIQSICIAACCLPIAISKYSIRENFLRFAYRFFIEAVNDEYDEFLIDNTESLIARVEEAIEDRMQDINENPVTQIIER